MTPDMYMDDSSSTASPRTSEAGGPLKVGPGQSPAAAGSVRATWQSTSKQETSAMPLAVDIALAEPACLACLPRLWSAGVLEALGQAACLLRAVTTCCMLQRSSQNPHLQPHASCRLLRHHPVHQSPMQRLRSRLHRRHRRC